MNRYVKINARYRYANGILCNANKLPWQQISTSEYNDDMETLSTLLAPREGNLLVTVGIPHEAPLIWRFDLSFGVSVSKLLNKHLIRRLLETLMLFHSNISTVIIFSIYTSGNNIT